MRPPGWPDELWWDTPTCLVFLSTALSAQLSTRGFLPCSIWCRQVWPEEEPFETLLSCYCSCDDFVLLQGLMTPEELRSLEDLPSPHNKFWVPCMWFVNLAMRARSEGRINNDVALTAILTVGVVKFSLINPFQRHLFWGFFFKYRFNRISLFLLSGTE